MLGIFSLIFLLEFRKDLDASLQNPVHVRDGNAVVGHGDSGVICTFHTIADLPFIEHTAATVDDQTVSGQIVRESGSTGKFKVQFFTSMLSDPTRELHSSDIVALAMMGAAFADQKGISVF